MKKERLIIAGSEDDKIIHKGSPSYQSLSPFKYLPIAVRSFHQQLEINLKK